MRLCEEYFKRHAVDVPCVQHCSAGALILRTDPAIWQCRWLLLTFRWAEHPQHPGTYIFDYSFPLHDGQLDGRLFSRLSPVEKEWDEYEDYILGWVNSVTGVQPVRGHKEIVLAVWEMFVLCYDGWFRRQPHDTKELLFTSLDEDLPIDERYAAYQDILIYLSTHHPAIPKVWKYDFLSQVQHYSDWLAKLVETTCAPRI